MGSSVQKFAIQSTQYKNRMIPFAVTTGAAQVETVTLPATAGATQGDFIVIYNQAGESEALWLDIDAAGTAPTASQYLAADTKTVVSIATGDSAATVKAAFVSAATLTGVVVASGAGATATVTQSVYGDCSNAVPKNAAGSGAGSITVSVGTEGLDASLGAGKFDGSVAQTVIGTYVVSFNEPFLRAPEVGVTVKTDNRVARVTASAVGSVTIETQNVVGGATANSDFSMIVVGSDHPDSI